MKYNTKLSGVTFGDGQKLIAGLAIEDNLVIIPDPANPHDPNALGVCLSHANGHTHIGWIPKALSAELAPRVAGRSIPVASWLRTGGGEGMSYGLIISFEVA